MSSTEIAGSVAAGGVRLEAAGYAPERPRATVVLLHGIPSVAPPEEGDEGYRGWSRRFAEDGFACVYADLRAARGAPGFFSLKGWVEDARALIEYARSLEAARGSPLCLVGSSAGGTVACEAIRQGARAEALVLLAAPAAWLSFASDPREGIRRISEEAGMALDASVLADPSAWAAEFDTITTESAIASVDCPVLIVHGTADEVVPVEHARLIAARCAHAEVRLLRGGAHQLRRDEVAVDLVAEWLRARFS